MAEPFCYSEQAISSAQHVGDLIIPHPLGHFATCTLSPCFVVMISFTSALLHLLHVNPLTPMPHLLQWYSIRLSFYEKCIVWKIV
jgi:hypothetical protein